MGFSRTENLEAKRGRSYTAYAFPDQASIRPGVTSFRPPLNTAQRFLAPLLQRRGLQRRLVFCSHAKIDSAGRLRARIPPARGSSSFTRPNLLTDGGKRLQVSFGALWLPPNFPPCLSWFRDTAYSGVGQWNGVGSLPGKARSTRERLRTARE